MFFILNFKLLSQSCSCSGIPTLTVGAAGAACSSVQQTGNIKSCSETSTVCSTSGGNDTRRGYYQFTATATSHNISVTSASGFDAIISVGTTCGAVDVLSCLDASGLG
ncbi:MAG: hypothetical protein EAZ85_10410 [Bacteroidetes bacterium]|nr:MAG: hypothetical protein EAZ85_10410 [Bacteroidota bacterium]